MKPYHIFIVDDDPWYRELLSYHLGRHQDITISSFENGKDCLDNLSANPDLITLDFSLPDINGDALFKKIKAVRPDVPVIIISAQTEVATAVKLFKMGANDYLIKDEATTDLLWNSINRIRENQALKLEVESLKDELGQKYTFQNSFIGQSEGVKKIFAMMEKASRTNINVFITGETGSGKEVVAKGIHYNSERKKKPFIAVNMAAIPRELVESELFGHEKGAFTGAAGRKKGKFEEAHGGTIFLDEIAELELSLQSKILRVLQEREITRVGSTERVKIDIRLIVATHRNLAEEVKKGTFRTDLYYRIMGLPVELPPLRERGTDILLLARFFADTFTRENNLNPISLSAAASDKLMAYNFPGNVRELKAIIELAIVMSDGQEISAVDIHFTDEKEKELSIDEERTLRQYTCDIISIYLKKFNNDIPAIADKLGIGKSTIYKMIRDKEIELSK